MLPSDLHPLVRRLRLKVRRKMHSSLLGNYHSLFKGSGLAFEDVREYQPGDDIRRLDWNVTARLNAPYVKRYTEERQRTILLMVDISGSLGFSTQSTGKRQALAEIAALLALVADGNRDRLGLLLFSSRVERYIPPGRMPPNVGRVLCDILNAETTQPGTDIRAALEFAGKLKLRKSVIFLMSDFQDDGYADALPRMGRAHEMFALRVFDPREESMPDGGLVRLRDAETGEIRLIDASAPALQREFHRRAALRSDQFRRNMQAAHVDHLELANTGGHLESLIRFFEVRAARQRHRR